MPQFLGLVSAFREQMNTTLSRSDVLKPLAWLIGILCTLCVALMYFHAPEWLLIAVLLLIVFIILLYAGAYIFCLIKDRDALRSEKYSLHKMAIEHGLLGDSVSGTFNATPQAAAIISQPESSQKEI